MVDLLREKRRKLKRKFGQKTPQSRKKKKSDYRDRLRSTFEQQTEATPTAATFMPANVPRYRENLTPPKPDTRQFEDNRLENQQQMNRPNVQKYPTSRPEIRHHGTSTPQPTTTSTNHLLSSTQEEIDYQESREYVEETTDSDDHI